MINYLNPNSDIIRDKALELTQSHKEIKDKVSAIFYFIRDQIEFAFLQDADFVSDIEILQLRKGQCNNKTILFHSLCIASGIESRIHFSTIRKDIHRGLFKGIIFKLMPGEISHSWLEVKIGYKWFRIDSYINDIDFYIGGKKKLLQEGLTTGYSVSCHSQSSNPDINFEKEGFVQMDAVLSDHGTYEHPIDYFTSGLHKNNPSPFKLMMYRLNLKQINKRVEETRLLGRTSF